MPDFRKPALFGGIEFESFSSGPDPATLTRAAHESAGALVARARHSGDPDVVERLVHYTDEHGIDAIAELWSHAGEHSLPGALWRLYLIRAMIRADSETAAFFYERGAATLRTIDHVVAGAPTPTGPDEVTELIDRILRGVFDGDLATALDRAASFCRVAAAGATLVADDQEGPAPDRAAAFTTRAARLASISDDLRTCARMAREDALD